MIEISKIKISNRHRKNLGDIASLAGSIEELGLLQSIVLDSDMRLIGGLRRIRAVQKLGWKSIPFQIAKNADDAIKKLKAERDENIQRLDFAPSEAVSIGEKLEAMEAADAKKRQRTSTGGRQPKLKPASEKFTEAGKGQTRDKVGAAVGMSGVTYEKAKKVIKAAKEKPDKFKAIADEMDKTRSVDRAFRAVRQIEAAESPPKKVIKMPGFPDGPFRCIVIDPPWPVEKIQFDRRPVEKLQMDYCVMTLDEIAKLSGQNSFNGLSPVLSTSKAQTGIRKAGVVGFTPLT